MKPEGTGPRYWHSLDELVGTPEFADAVRREFPDDEWDRLPPATRRQFLKVMGASLAFAGLTACRWPAEEIVPYAHRPEGRVPGVPESFATAMEMAGSAVGVAVTSFDGRPIKCEGNPEHPDSLGALSAVGQAGVLEMYDPDRSGTLVLREQGQRFTRSWDEFGAAISERLVDRGSRVAVLAEESSSPTLARLRDRLLARLPDLGWYTWEPISRDAERQGTELAFGRPLRVLPRLDRAEVVACFDADPVAEHPQALRLARQLAERRDPERGAMARLWAVEPGRSLTGALADHRLAVAPSLVPAALAQLARLLADEHEVVLPADIAAAVASHEVGANGLDAGWLRALAADLATERGAGVVLVGPRQEPDVHALAAVLNQAIGSPGVTVGYVPAPEPDRPSHVAAVTELAGRLGAGEIDTLLILGGNPAYDAPADLGFGELLDAVPLSVHLGLYEDETSARCTWHLPRAHWLEGWSDARAFDGTVSVVQPLIAPLYGGRTPAEVLSTMLGDRPVSGYELVRETARQLAPAGDFEAWWRGVLRSGLVEGSGWGEVRPEVDGEGIGVAAHAIAARADSDPPAAGRLDLVLAPDPKTFDGRFANNGWLQELPDAVTKITWDNALVMSIDTARSAGIDDGDVVEVTVGNAGVELPVYLVPGVAAHTVLTTLGYGRSAAGQVGDGVGADTYALRSSAEPDLRRGVAVRPTGRRATLATTQDHHVIDMRGFAARNQRVEGLVRETTLDRYLEDPEVIHHGSHHPPLISLWKEKVYQGEQWGMAIDLNSCIGCNACMVACQAENNVPVVGREQVINQREMHWIRVDRYFKTDPDVAAEDADRAEMVFQPLTCVHCEMAPCEQVCPVAATQHTEDGLNAMVYNRCVGTRYCSNNCPFKVRRFNFFNYHADLSEVQSMQYNPEVTVRSRGVMEKCTYCVQRIENVRIRARNEGRPVRDGEVVPACAQTCPTRAIVFGNLNDPSSEVSKLRAGHRSYATLAELNIKPRTHYLARLRNPAAGLAPEEPAQQHGDDQDHEEESA